MGRTDIRGGVFSYLWGVRLPVGSYSAFYGPNGYRWDVTDSCGIVQCYLWVVRIAVGWYNDICGPNGFPWGRTLLSVGERLSVGSYNAIYGPNGFLCDRTLLSVGRTAICVLVLGNIHANGFLWERNKLSVGEKYNFWAERIPVGISPIFRFMKDLDIPTSYFGKLLYRVFCLIAFLIKKLNIYIPIELNVFTH